MDLQVAPGYVGFPKKPTDAPRERSNERGRVRATAPARPHGGGPLAGTGRHSAGGPQGGRGPHRARAPPGQHLRAARAGTPVPQAVRALPDRTGRRAADPVLPLRLPPRRTRPDRHRGGGRLARLLRLAGAIRARGAALRVPHLSPAARPRGRAGRFPGRRGAEPPRARGWRGDPIDGCVAGTLVREGSGPGVSSEVRCLRLLPVLRGARPVRDPEPGPLARRAAVRRRARLRPPARRPGGRQRRGVRALPRPRAGRGARQRLRGRFLLPPGGIAARLRDLDAPGEVAVEQVLRLSYDFGAGYSTVVARLAALGWIDDPRRAHLQRQARTAHRQGPPGAGGEAGAAR